MCDLPSAAELRYDLREELKVLRKWKEDLESKLGVACINCKHGQDNADHTDCWSCERKMYRSKFMKVDIKCGSVE